MDMTPLPYSTLYTWKVDHGPGAPYHQRIHVHMLCKDEYGIFLALDPTVSRTYLGADINLAEYVENLREEHTLIECTPIEEINKHEFGPEHRDRDK